MDCPESVFLNEKTKWSKGTKRDKNRGHLQTLSRVKESIVLVQMKTLAICDYDTFLSLLRRKSEFPFLRRDLSALERTIILIWELCMYQRTE